LVTAAVGAANRSISSHVLQPTSPIQTSPVPGRTPNLNGFRRPYATIRRALGSRLPAFGVSSSAAPVAC
jgi:hypothetical protein